MGVNFSGSVPAPFAVALPRSVESSGGSTLNLRFHFLCRFHLSCILEPPCPVFVVQGVGLVPS